MNLDGRFIVSRCFALDKRDGTGRTGWQAVSQTVTVIIF